MPVWIQHIEISIRELARIVPLELFISFGAFAEEIIAPIPSMLVTTTAGFFAQVEGRTAFFVVWLAILGGLGKLAGSFIYYLLGDKLEDVVVGRYGRYLGLNHADVERIGRRFNGHHWQDGALIFTLRVIPFVPTVLVSIACGVVRIQTRVFLIASYAGNFFKDLFYVFVGYYGIRALKVYLMDIERVRFGVGVVATGLVIGSLVFLYVHRHHSLHLFRRLMRWLKPGRTSRD
ncbi:MAG: VTT domain-containing protein [Candidatus Moraniibacteriota bacterium]